MWILNRVQQNLINSNKSGLTASLINECPDCLQGLYPNNGSKIYW